MITREEIEEIIKEAKKAKHVIVPSDINNVILNRFIADKSLIVADFEDYFSRKEIKWLVNYMSKNVFDDEGITFDENKKALLDLIERNKKLLERGEIDPKDALKIEADIRVKLNDKFKVQDDTREQVVIVEPKYNHICRFGHECYLPTKEDLIKMYNLVEKK